MKKHNVMFEYVRQGGKRRPIKDSEGKVVRMGGGKRVGAMVAVPVGNDVLIGWTKCHLRSKDGPKYTDKFDSKVAILAAAGRAALKSDERVPHSVKKQLKRFIERAKRYYKDKTVITSYLNI